MGADELEDYLQLRDRQTQRRIEESDADIRAARTRPARDLLLELRSGAGTAGAARRPPPAALARPAHKARPRKASKAKRRI